MKNIRLLSIGNSFSDDMHQYMYDILRENYCDAVIANLYIGGCTLKHHYENILNDNHEYVLKIYDKDGYHEYYDYSIADTFKYKWDIITLQQASYESGDKNKFVDLNTGIGYVNLIHDYYMKHYDNLNEIKWYYHATWSYDIDFKGDTFKFYDYSQEKMERGMLDALNKHILYNPIFTGVIPNFYSIKELREKYNINPYRDGFHLSYGIGRFTAAFTACMTILGKVPHRPKIEYDEVSAQDKRIAKHICEYIFNNKDDLYII